MILISTLLIALKFRIKICCGAPVFILCQNQRLLYLRKYTVVVNSDLTSSAVSLTPFIFRPWDMARFLRGQCEISEIPYPKWAKRWINVRKSFSNFYDLTKVKLTTMLEHLGLVFEGHHHSGLDDSRNIARVVLCLLRDGAELRVNECLFPGNVTPGDPQSRFTLPVSRREAEMSTDSEAEEDLIKPIEINDATSNFSILSKE